MEAGERVTPEETKRLEELKTRVAHGTQWANPEEIAWLLSLLQRQGEELAALKAMLPKGDSQDVIDGRPGEVWPGDIQRAVQLLGGYLVRFEFEHMPREVIIATSLIQGEQARMDETEIELARRREAFDGLFKAYETTRAETRREVLERVLEVMRDMPDCVTGAGNTIEGAISRIDFARALSKDNSNG